MTAPLILSADQSAAIGVVIDWLSSGHQGGDLTLGGYAGTGKTTIVSHMLSNHADFPRPGVMAPTGRAAEVLRRKGIEARTIHSVIYDYAGTYIDPATNEERIRWRDKDAVDAPRWWIVDEASMVSEFVYRDVNKLHVPVLWVGDHGQLSPVGGDPGLMRDPTIRLEKIHRQAEGSAIIAAAHRVRAGAEPVPWDSPDGSVRITRLTDSLPRLVDAWLALGVEQAACAYNRTRHAINRYYRAALGRHGERTVVAGERMICLHNDRRHGLMNGTIFSVVSVHGETAEGWDCRIRDDENWERDVRVWRGAVNTDDWRIDDRPVGTIVADYGYCITVHKSQGGQWGTFALLDQRCRAWSMPRWRYTAFTRAAQRLIVALE